ncbi:ash family protein [Escherichia coli]|nr:ash family protein [Escherichia coli]
MTRHIVRGYISDAAAKSVVGIGTPDIETVHNRASGFFMR